MYVVRVRAYLLKYPPPFAIERTWSIGRFSRLTKGQDTGHLKRSGKSGTEGHATTAFRAFLGFLGFPVFSVLFVLIERAADGGAVRLSINFKSALALSPNFFPK